MEPFTTHTGRAVPLRRSNVDTDQIIPASYLKRVSRAGFGEGLFAAWREDPSFVLNQPEYDGATILVAGNDFGTGSSREHAVWALTDYGFRAVIAPRFGDIFRTNSTKAGLLPVALPEATVSALQDAIEADPATEVVVDLDNRLVLAEAAGIKAAFEIDGYTRWRLMEGLDDIGLTLRHVDDITAFEHSRPTWHPRHRLTPPSPPPFPATPSSHRSQPARVAAVSVRLKRSDVALRRSQPRLSQPPHCPLACLARRSWPSSWTVTVAHTAVTVHDHSRPPQLVLMRITCNGGTTLGPTGPPPTRGRGAQLRMVHMIPT